jgi:nucleoid DNA-binding protein
MATVTKRDLVVHLTDKLEQPPQRVVAAVVDAVIQHIADSLARGDEVALRGLGTFAIRRRAPRRGRNPKDPGREIPVPERAAVQFRPAADLRDRVAQLLPQLGR